MKAELTVEMDNAAFEDNPFELSRILRELADTLENDEIKAGKSFALRDLNGNKVGVLKFND